MWDECIVVNFSDERFAVSRRKSLLLSFRQDCAAGTSVASRVSREVPPRGKDLGWGMIGTHGVPPWSYRRTERACSRKSYRTDGFATFRSIRSFRQDCAAGASVASRVSREVPPRGRDLGWGMIGTHGVPPWSYCRTERACSRKSYRTDGFATFRSIRSFRQDCAAGASVASRVSREVPPRGRDLGWGMIGNHGVPPWSYRRTDGRAAGNPIERTGLQYVVARSLR